MSNTVIKVENLSKSYMVGHNHAQSERYTALRDVIARDVKNFARKTRDMFRGKAIIQGDEVEEFWALKDVSFEINQGDRIGIIGRNGAGKSTLLKILSRITEPTSGRISIQGRVASLLEVGTGFHPELTGRENIFLNGAILGMGRKEIQRKFDEIVDFAEVERFLDTPVKRYSSGMYVRLAFAVAAHLEPEILIVDEVLAVGDAQFQKKCLGKMEDVGKEGRTVIFVSHNMASIISLCERCIVLGNGRIMHSGPSGDAVKIYLGGGAQTANRRKIEDGKDGFILSEISIGNTGRIGEDIIERNLGIEIHFTYLNHSEHSGIYLNTKFKDDEGNYFMVTASSHCSQNLRKGNNKAVLHIPAFFFNEGTFSMDIMVIGKDQNGYHGFYSETDILMFQVLPNQKALGEWMGKEVGQITPRFEWSI